MTLKIPRKDTEYVFLDEYHCKPDFTGADLWATQRKTCPRPVQHYVLEHNGEVTTSADEDEAVTIGPYYSSRAIVVRVLIDPDLEMMTTPQIRGLKSLMEDLRAKYETIHEDCPVPLTRYLRLRGWTAM